MTKTVILVSADAEWNGVKSLFPDTPLRQTPYGESMDLNLRGRNFHFFQSGWGKISSAGAIQYVIDRFSPDLLVNLGTCGGFEGVVKKLELIVVDETFVYDIVELMDDMEIIQHYASKLDLSWLPEPYPHPARRGLLASADSDLPPEKIAFLRSKGAIAADWESGALAWVARRNNARLLILRMVSDLVSEGGGEAYGEIEIYREQAKKIMKILIDQLPDWVDAVRL